VLGRARPLGRKDVPDAMIERAGRPALRARAPGEPDAVPEQRRPAASRRAAGSTLSMILKLRAAR